MKIIAATVYEWERDGQRRGGNGTENEEVVRRKTVGKEKEYEHNENPAAGHCREHSEAHADKQIGTYLQGTAANLFVHGENEQETNQLQKSMSTEISAKH